MRLYLHNELNYEFCSRVSYTKSSLSIFGCSFSFYLYLIWVSFGVDLSYFAKYPLTILLFYYIVLYFSNDTALLNNYCSFLMH